MKFNYPKQNEHVVSSTQDKPIGHGTGLNDLKRAIQNWGPEILGFGGDIMDVAGNIIQRAQGKRGPNIRPGEFGNSARRRFATPERAPNTQTYIEEPSDPSTMSTLGTVANPFLFMSPSKLAGLTQQYPHLASVIAASHGMDIPSGALGVIKERGGNWLPESVERGLKNFQRYAEPSDIATLKRELANHENSPLIKDTLQQQLDGLNTNQVLNDWIKGPLTKYVGGYAEGGLIKEYPPNHFDDLNIFLGLDPH